MTWDVVVVGGGAAGLSGALVLGRARRRTLLVDAAGQSNRTSAGIGGLLGHDGRPPAELYRMGRSELAAYDAVEVRDGEVTHARAQGDGFVVTLADGGEERTRRLLLATGMTYATPELPGLPELWGRSAFHCPFCHGWEHRDGALAVLGTLGIAHRAPLLRLWSDDVVVLTGGEPLSAEDATALTAGGFPVDSRPVAALEPGEDGSLAAVRFADGERLARSGVLVAAPLRARSPLPAQLGADTTPDNPMNPDGLAIDAWGRTSVPGLSAAGDLAVDAPQAAAAIASGSRAAAGLVQGLL